LHVETLVHLWRFDRFTLDLGRGVLLCQDDELPLRPKSFALLRLLVENAGRLIERGAIMEALWPGVIVGDEGITQCVHDIRRALSDDGTLVRTVPRRGYVLDAVAIAAMASADQAPVRPERPGAAPALPEGPSIAVLPFQNLTGDPAEDYVADGIVEDVTTELARLRWLFVAARNSSFACRRDGGDVRRIGRELGVRYVLEGSLRRCGPRVRVTGQLIDARSGMHLWAERFDGEAQDLFELQDGLTASVVAALAPELKRAELERVRRKPSPGAYDRYLRGLEAFHRFQAADNAAAFALFREAAAIDPGFAAAHGMAARCYLQRKAFGWASLTAAEIADADRLARRAADLGRDDPVALGAAGGALLGVVGAVENGAELVDRALALSASLAWIWNYGAYARLYLGEPAATVEHGRRALRLSPRDPQTFGIKSAIALGQFFEGRYESAQDWARAALADRPTFLVALCAAVISAALAGRIDRAKEQWHGLRALYPALAMADLVDLLPFRRPADRARWRDGLLAADAGS
jgi:TolB-like protein